MRKINRNNSLTLKWGSLKSWSFETDPEAQEILKQYFALGVSMSAISQKDTTEQKELICKLIGRVYGRIYLDWDGKYVSKKEAIKYVMGY